jgi:hypothetical protein
MVFSFQSFFISLPASRPQSSFNFSIPKIEFHHKKEPASFSKRALLGLNSLKIFEKSLKPRFGSDAK